MVDYKEILRLSQQYYSLRQIAASVCHSHHTVKNVLDLAALHGMPSCAATAFWLIPSSFNSWILAYISIPFIFCIAFSMVFFIIP